MAKTRVAPIKRQTIPRLELCGSIILAQILEQCKKVLQISSPHVFAWNDSTIVLHWLQGNPCIFKVFVGNRVAQIMELLPPDRWRHVESGDNPADCASRGLYPLELLAHGLWWNGPTWLKLDPSNWPRRSILGLESVEDPAELCSNACTTTTIEPPLVEFDRFSVFAHLVRVTAWVVRFCKNCRPALRSALTTAELNHATNYWLKFGLRSNSRILSLNPLLDEQGMLRVGGRQDKANLSFNKIQSHCDQALDQI